MGNHLSGTKASDHIEQRVLLHLQALPPSLIGLCIYNWAKVHGYKPFLELNDFIDLFGKTIFQGERYKDFFALFSTKNEEEEEEEEEEKERGGKKQEYTSGKKLEACSLEIFSTLYLFFAPNMSIDDRFDAIISIFQFLGMPEYRTADFQHVTPLDLVRKDEVSMAVEALTLGLSKLSSRKPVSRTLVNRVIESIFTDGQITLPWALVRSRLQTLPDVVHYLAVFLEDIHLLSTLVDQFNEGYRILSDEYSRITVGLTNFQPTAIATDNGSLQLLQAKGGKRSSVVGGAAPLLSMPDLSMFSSRRPSSLGGGGGGGGVGGRKKSTLSFGRKESTGFAGVPAAVSATTADRKQSVSNFDRRRLSSSSRLNMVVQDMPIQISKAIAILQHPSILPPLSEHEISTINKLIVATSEDSLYLQKSSFVELAKAMVAFNLISTQCSHLDARIKAKHVQMLARLMKESAAKETAVASATAAAAAADIEEDEEPEARQNGFVHVAKASLQSNRHDAFNKAFVSKEGELRLELTELNKMLELEETKTLTSIQRGLGSSPSLTLSRVKFVEHCLKHVKKKNTILDKELREFFVAHDVAGQGFISASCAYDLVLAKVKNGTKKLLASMQSTTRQMADENLSFIANEFRDACDKGKKGTLTFDAIQTNAEDLTVSLGKFHAYCKNLARSEKILFPQNAKRVISVARSRWITAIAKVLLLNRVNKMRMFLINRDAAIARMEGRKR